MCLNNHPALPCQKEHTSLVNLPCSREGKPIPSRKDGLAKEREIKEYKVHKGSQNAPESTCYKNDFREKIVRTDDKRLAKI